MYVRRIGSGPVSCFAIPGWGEDHTSLLPLEQHLQSVAEVHVVDPPGYGSSPRPQPFEIPETVRLLKQAYAQAGLGSAQAPDTIIGNCSGAILAAELAMVLDPTPVRLVFIDPFAFLPGYFRVFLKRGFGKMAYQSTFANPVGRWITNQMVGGRQEQSTDMTSTFRVTDHEVTYQYLKLFGGLPGIEKYAPLQCAVTIITGGKTFAAVRRSITMWREIWPHAQVTELANSGHLPIREAPQELVQSMFADGRNVERGGA